MSKPVAQMMLSTSRWVSEASMMPVGVILEIGLGTTVTLSAVRASR